MDSEDKRSSDLWFVMFNALVLYEEDSCLADWTSGFPLSEFSVGDVFER